MLGLRVGRGCRGLGCVLLCGGLCAFGGGVGRWFGGHVGEEVEEEREVGGVVEEEFERSRERECECEIGVERSLNSMLPEDRLALVAEFACARDFLITAVCPATMDRVDVFADSEDALLKSICFDLSSEVQVKKQHQQQAESSPKEFRVDRLAFFPSDTCS